MRRAPEADRPVDLLLLNGSNYPGHAVFPYAFVQVSALARQYGLTVKRLELLPHAHEHWPALIEHAVAQHRPRMVGTHLRQADSQYVPGYIPTPGNDGPIRSYFPVEHTRRILDCVRQHTDAPTVVGGFGFTAQAPHLVERLAPDLAVRGEPDVFFQRFERVLSARAPEAVADIPNLILRNGSGYHFNERQFLDPLAAPEYDDEIFAELLSFYAALGRSLSIGQFGEADVPVEAVRGCPCACYFCTEPAVKGKRVRHRDLDAIMEDIAFLGARNVHSVFLIGSELNMGGMDFPLALAERMLRFNEKRPGREVHWKAYTMPKPGMRRDELALMMRAGFFPGWNEFASFDNDNLKRCRVPYRTRQVVDYFRDVLELSEDPEIYSGPPLLKFEIFLGNAFMDPAGVRNTLRVIDEEGFSDRHPYGDVITATRVYDLDGTLCCGTADTSFSVDRQGRRPFDPSWPSFHYAPALVAALGSPEAVEVFLAFVSNTMISSNYKLRQTVSDFLRRHVDAAHFCSQLRACVAGPACAALMGERLQIDREDPESLLVARAQAEAEALWNDPTPARLRALLGPELADARVAETALRQVLRVLLHLHREQLASVCAFLGLPAPGSDAYRRLTPYRVMRALYARFDSEEELLGAAQAACEFTAESVTALGLRYLLYSYAVKIVPSYRDLLFEPSRPTHVFLPVLTETGAGA